MTRARGLVAALALAVAAVACTGGGSASKDKTGTFPSTAKTSASDDALVKKVVLRIEDLPPEWAALPPADPVGQEGDNSRYAECVGRPDPKTIRTATVDSQQFHVEERMRAVVTVETMPDVATATDDFAAQEGDRGLPCLRQRYQNQIDRQTDAGKPRSFTIERLPPPTYGDKTLAFRLVLTYAGDAPNGFLDVVNVRKGRFELSFAFLNAQQPFPADLERDAVTKVVARV